MSTFQDHGLNVAVVQAIMSSSLHPIILQAFCHGIHTCIFFIALCYIIESTQPTRKRAILASIILFLWVADTVILELEWQYVGRLFIAHGASLETEFDFILADDAVSLSLAVSALRILSALLADLILMWRCWVLYGGNLKILVVPSVFVITEIISGAIVMSSVVAANSVVGASQIYWSLVYYSMTVATNSLCTLLILFRIVQVSGIRASLKTYRGIIEILLESAAMYAIIYIALLIVYAYEFYTGVTVMTAFTYPQVISYSITGIAPTLIIARVMAGQSRPDDSWTRPSLPHIRSNVLSATESLHFANALDQSAQTMTTNSGNADPEVHGQGSDGDEDRGT